MAISIAEPRRCFFRRARIAASGVASAASGSGSGSGSGSTSRSITIVPGGVINRGPAFSGWRGEALSNPGTSTLPAWLIENGRRDALSRASIACSSRRVSQTAGSFHTQHTGTASIKLGTPRRAVNRHRPGPQYWSRAGSASTIKAEPTFAGWARRGGGSPPVLPRQHQPPQFSVSSVLAAPRPAAAASQSSCPRPPA